MVNVIGQLLPLMVAVALSSVPIMVVVTILLAPGSRPSALSFLIGWLVGIFGITGLVTLGLRAVPRTSALRSQQLIGVIEIVIGCGLLASAIFLFARTRAAHPRSELPRWVRAVGTVRPIAALGLGLVLNLRPKAILLSIAAAGVLGTARLTDGETLFALVVFTLVGASTVGLPVILSLVNPGRARKPLEATERWIVRNSATVTFVMLLVIGTVVLGDGLTRL